MRITDLDFILIPEWLAGPTAAQPDDDHWISRWERNLSTARWLDGSSGEAGVRLINQIDNGTSRPVMIVTHGGGVDALLAAREGLGGRAVAGAFIVAPTPDLARTDMTDPKRLRLPCPSVLIASDDHPQFGPSDAEALAGALGSFFVPAGPAGRLDSSSGQGPWPEGLLRLGWFLKRLTKH